MPAESSQLVGYVRALPNVEGFQGVTSLAVVRDAETDADAALCSVQDALKRAGLEPPKEHGRWAGHHPKVGIFILPDGTRAGMLETLCLASVRDDPAIECVEQYLECIKAKGLRSPANLEKARLHAYLAGKTESYVLVGRAAQKGYWPFAAPAFAPLRAFLGEM